MAISSLDEWLSSLRHQWTRRPAALARGILCAACVFATACSSAARQPTLPPPEFVPPDPVPDDYPPPAPDKVGDPSAPSQGDESQASPAVPGDATTPEAPAPTAPEPAENTGTNSEPTFIAPSAVD